MPDMIMALTEFKHHQCVRTMTAADEGPHNAEEGKCSVVIIRFIATDRALFSFEKC